MQKSGSYFKNVIGENMFDVTALGELLIDFTSGEKSETGMRLFEQNPGGAPGNVLTALSKCGLSTAVLGKIGNDLHGNFLKETLKKYHICIDGLVMDDSVFTTLAFVEIGEKGERNFSFARKPGADTMLQASEISEDIIKSSRIFHIGSLSLTDEPSRDATWFALKKAVEFGCVISYDPNYRASLWNTVQDAVREMKSVLSYVDIIKLSDEETELLTGIQNPFQAAMSLVETGIPVVVVTLGKEGAYVCTKEGGKKVPGYVCNAIDTTGAGDCFWGGFLYQFIKRNKSPKSLTLEEGVRCAHFGNAMASLCVEKRGGIPSIPSLEEVIKREKLF